MIRVERELPASPGALWDASIDTARWPTWGPSLQAATLDHSGGRIRLGSTGEVRTVVGLKLRFTITEWEEGRWWAWEVGGLRATGHGVEPALEPNRGKASISVPVWAPFYAPLCWVALGRLGRSAADR